MTDYDAQKLLTLEQEGAGMCTAVEEAVDEICRRGFQNLYFIGIGGSYASALIVQAIVRERSTLPLVIANAGELIHRNEKNLTKDSVVFVYSVSGDTPEILEAVKKCKAIGAAVYGIVERADSPLAGLLDHLIVQGNGGFYKLYYFFGALMNRRGEFPEYERMCQNLARMPEELMRVYPAINKDAFDFAQRYWDAPLCYLVGSGNVWGCAYSLAMCYMEEMQWMRTKSIRAAEFFHGTLEVIEKGVCVMLLKGEDDSRPEMERVERFCQRVTDELFVFDTKNYSMPGIDADMRGLLAPFLCHAIQERVLHSLEAVRCHPAELRRYYRQISY